MGPPVRPRASVCSPGACPRYSPAARRSDGETLLAEIDHLLALDGGDPPVRWHCPVDGPCQRVHVLDSRTRRTFLSRTSPLINLSPSALREQVPDMAEQPPPARVELLVVVSPLPILGGSLFDEFAGQIAARAYDVNNFGAILRNAGERSLCRRGVVERAGRGRRGARPIGRRKGAGRGEGSSGLRFDSLLGL